MSLATDDKIVYAPVDYETDTVKLSRSSCLCSAQCYTTLLLCFSEHKHVAKNVSRTARGIVPPSKTTKQHTLARQVVKS
jgi:hypothetical protein